MEISKYDTVISMFIGFIIGFIPILLITVLNKKNTNLFDLIKSLYSNTIYKIITTIIIIFLTYTLIVITNDLITFANVKYLFETPNLFIAFLFIIPCFYIINKGIETIGRTSIVLFIISLVLYFTSCFALIKYIDIDNIKPILSSNIKDIIKGSVYFVIYSVTPILFLGIVPKNNDNNYNKNLIIGYIISCLSTIIITFLVLTIYNYEYIKLFSYPEYFTLKKINYGFIANIENIMSLFFIIDYFISILVLLYCLIYFVKKVINIKEKSIKPIAIIIGLIICILSTYAFKDNTIAIMFSKEVYIITNIIFIAFFFSTILFKMFINKIKGT